MRITLLFAIVIAVVGLGWLSGAYDHIAAHVAVMQREYQNVLASAVQAVRRGDPGAVAGLIAACLAYGFLHAIGPGHGKFLIGGLGLSSRGGVGKFVTLSLASSLAQAGVAVILVYGGFALLDLSGRWLMMATERFLAPASHAAIGVIGAWLAYQAIRTLAAMPRPEMRRETMHVGPRGHDHGHRHHHDHGCCGHAHGPTPEEAEAIKSWRQAVPIVAGIAMRPCTGAVLLLILSWRLQTYIAGVAGVVAMGVGVGAFLSLVASSSVLARKFAILQARVPETGAVLVFAGVRLLAGASIVLIAVYFLLSATPSAFPVTGR